MKDNPYNQKQQEDDKAAEVARAADACPVEWGNCSKTEPRYWGKPSDTPHRCNGKATHVRRAIGKLHACEVCQYLGGLTVPSPYSKAGAQLRAATMAHAARTEAKQ